jgi:hypothetical protein
VYENFVLHNFVSRDLERDTKGTVPQNWHHNFVTVSRNLAPSPQFTVYRRALGKKFDIITKYSNQRKHFRLWGVHIAARALLDINMIWFGYIARL